MGALDATYDALKAIYTADSGAGGINGTGNAKIVSLVRHTDALESPPLPACTLRLTPARSYDGRSDAMTLVQAQFIVTVDRAQGFTRTNAIRDRIRTKYNGVTVSASGGYSFSKPVWRNSEDTERDTKRIIVETYEMLAFTTGSAPYLGFDANFSGYSGGTCFYFELDRTIEVLATGGEAEDNETYDTGVKSGNGTARFYVTGLPPEPGLYSGCVFTLASGVTLTADVIVHRTQTVCLLGQAQAQVVEASFVVTGGFA